MPHGILCDDGGSSNEMNPARRTAQVESMSCENIEHSVRAGEGVTNGNYFSSPCHPVQEKPQHWLVRSERSSNASPSKDERRAKAQQNPTRGVRTFGGRARAAQLVIRVQ